MYDFYFENKRHNVVVNRNVWKRFTQNTRIRNQRTNVLLCNRAEDMSAYEYRKAEDTSRRNGNQLGAASYDWDLTYWQATLANLRRDLLGLSQRPTASDFPEEPTLEKPFFCPQWLPALAALHLHCAALAFAIGLLRVAAIKPSLSHFFKCPCLRNNRELFDNLFIHLTLSQSSYIRDFDVAQMLIQINKNKSTELSYREIRMIIFCRCLLLN